MTEVVRQVVFSGHTSASSLHHLMQVNFHHRQGEGDDIVVDMWNEVSVTPQKQRTLFDLLGFN